MKRNKKLTIEELNRKIQQYKQAQDLLKSITLTSQNKDTEIEYYTRKIQEMEEKIQKTKEKTKCQQKLQKKN